MGKRYVFHGVRIAFCAAIALWGALAGALPARADGPLIPGYTIRDGQRVPAPTGYVQAGKIDGAGQPCGAFANPQDLFRDPATGRLLVADTGNDRIVILDEEGVYLFEIGGKEAGLKGPQGTFVDVDGNIWVADTGNGRIVKFGPDGAFQAEYHKPQSDLIEAYGFSPSKIVLDKRGFIYVVVGSEGNLGVVVMDTNERFRGFFGRTKVKFNLGRVLARLVASEAQRRRMMRVRPAPIGNIHIDDLGFIYAVSPVLTKDQIQRLNTVGENVYGEVGLRTGAGRLWDKLKGVEGITFGESETKWRWDGDREISVPYQLTSTFVDVGVDELGIVSALDQQRKLVYQYDQAGNLLSIFGGEGMREGGLLLPVSIVAGKNGRLYILDAGRGTIQIFRPTEITRLIQEASHKYFDGKYEEAAVLWAQIARRNTNFALAHSGLGKALMRQERYVEAMAEYRYAEDKGGYSAAFREYRYLWLRHNFPWLGIGAFVVLGGTAITIHRLSDGFRRLLASIRRLRERSGLWAVPIMLTLAVLVRMVGLLMLSFHFQTQRPEQIRMLFEAGKVIIPWITWCIAAVAVAEIFYGEGTFRQIVISSAWDIWPYIVFTIPVSLMTHVLTLDEKSFYQAGTFLIYALLAWNFFRQTRDLHNFETGKALGVMLLTLVGMVGIWALAGLVYALTGEVVRFVQQLALEIYVRQY